MNKLLEHFKQYVVNNEKRNALLLALLFIFIVSEDNSLYLVLKYAGIAALLISLGILNETYINKGKAGPIKWYASPILWLGIPAILGIIWVFSW